LKASLAGAKMERKKSMKTRKLCSSRGHQTLLACEHRRQAKGGEANRKKKTHAAFGENVGKAKKCRCCGLKKQTWDETYTIKKALENTTMGK